MSWGWLPRMATRGCCWTSAAVATGLAVVRLGAAAQRVFFLLHSASTAPFLWGLHGSGWHLPPLALRCTLSLENSKSVQHPPGEPPHPWDRE